MSLPRGAVACWSVIMAFPGHTHLFLLFIFKLFCSCLYKEAIHINANLIQRGKLSKFTKIVSEYDQEIPQSQTADYPLAPRGRAAQPSQDTRKTK